MIVAVEIPFPVAPVLPVVPLMFPEYTHFAADAAPATVHLYVSPVDVFKYMSFTLALATPELEKMVAVVEVPVIPVPLYH